MEATDIEKLNQLISRNDISGNDKVSWLIDFIDGREFQMYETSYSEEDILKAQQAILCNIKDAHMDTNYILEYLQQLKK